MAEEIRLSVAEPYLRDHRGAEKFKVPKFIDRALVVKHPPVAFGLGECKLVLADREIKDWSRFGVLTEFQQISETPTADEIWKRILFDRLLKTAN